MNSQLLLVETTVHGRVLVRPGTNAHLLVGFHGYAESAGDQLPRLVSIPSARDWTLASIQGLNRFYRSRTDAVVANWMTRQDRDLAIADNLAYVAAVLDQVDAEHPGATRIVVTGFSQGVAMAFRAAAASARRIDGIIAAGGDVPPELDSDALARVPRALVCRGTADEWYTETIADRDIQRLRAANVRVTPVAFAGGHEWSEAVVQAAAQFLADV